ncbi:type II secretion system protein [Novipirellula caenicola]|uniref:Prepilin-type N-terminal cleavage/methylation domain-containing protein n=1 Tax=Novipirellula caenicola TaxID=1536901 RepID=A0ABP9W4D2_9BACT
MIRSADPSSIMLNRPTQKRNGFSLLEILLSIAILGGSLAVLSQLALTGTDAAREARELSVARILCQTKLSEILLQDISPQSLPMSPVESADTGSMIPFQYSVEVQPGSLDGLLSVRVTVEATDPDSGVAIATYALTRWMIDPALGLAEAEAEEEAAEEAEAAEAAE